MTIAQAIEFRLRYSAALRNRAPDRSAPARLRETRLGLCRSLARRPTTVRRNRQTTKILTQDRRMRSPSPPLPLRVSEGSVYETAQRVWLVGGLEQVGEVCDAVIAVFD